MVPILWLKAPGHDGTLYSLLPTPNAQPSTTMPNFMVMSWGGHVKLLQMTCLTCPLIPIFESS